MLSEQYCSMCLYPNVRIYCYEIVFTFNLLKVYIIESTVPVYGRRREVGVCEKRRIKQLYVSLSSTIHITIFHCVFTVAVQGDDYTRHTVVMYF